MEKILLFMIKCYVLYSCFKCLICQSVQSEKFERKVVGYNPALDNNRMVVTMQKSRVACGSYCTEQKCTSFIYDSTERQCTLYSVYMIGDRPISGNYYVTTGTDETITVVGTSQSVAYNSSFTNVALGKSVTLSSVWYSCVGSLMVNGVRDALYPHCAHTHLETNPYMVVDLGLSYNVHSLYVLNRKDCCSWRLFNLKIELGVTTEAMEMYVYHDGIVGAECTFILDHVTVARYVRLTVVGQTYFTVCEFGVYSLG